MPKRATSRWSLVLLLILCSVWGEAPSPSYLNEGLFLTKDKGHLGPGGGGLYLLCHLLCPVISTVQIHCPPDFKMELFFNPFDNLVCILLGISFTVWFTLLLVFIIVPAIFGVSFGIRRLYMKTLLKIFEVRAGCIMAHFFFIWRNEGTQMLTAVWADVSTINNNFCVEAEDVGMETLYTHNVKVCLRVCYFSCTVPSWNNYLSPVPAKHPEIQQTIVCKSCRLCSAGTACICSGCAFVFHPFNQHKSFCFWTALV